jgi:hypothetical protein
LHSSAVGYETRPASLLHDKLITQRQASPNTIAAYRGHLPTAAGVRLGADPQAEPLGCPAVPSMADLRHSASSLAASYWTAGRASEAIAILERHVFDDAWSGSTVLEQRRRADHAPV